jgi:hypothetical protein
MTCIRHRSGGSWSTDARTALDFSWELDFWGRNRQLLATALSGEQAAEADRHAARLAIAVAVVQAYVQFDLNYALLDVTNDNLKQQQSILDLTQQRVGAGLETVARVKQSEGTVALTRAGLAFVEASLALSRNQLADLVGAGPDRGQALTRPQLHTPAEIVLPSTLPADLLGRRPDVVAARAQVEAAAHDIKAAEADFYPNVNLTAFAGFQAFGLSQLFESSDRIAGAGPALSLPVFNRGALRGQLYGRQAQFDSFVGQYNQTLLDAVKDVADVVANWQGLEQSAAATERARGAEAPEPHQPTLPRRPRQRRRTVGGNQLAQTLRGTAGAAAHYSVDLVRARRRHTPANENPRPSEAAGITHMDAMVETAAAAPQLCASAASNGSSSSPWASCWWRSPRRRWLLYASHYWNTDVPAWPAIGERHARVTAP